MSAAVGPDLSVEVGGVRLKNPILAASGTFGYGLEFEPYVDLAALGGFVTKGLTLEARPGNSPRRIAETPCGMLNAIGLQNVGIDVFLAAKLPKLAALDTAAIVNVNGKTAGEYLDLVRRLEGYPGIAALELNVSCPNVERGGREFGTDAEVLAALVGAVRKVTRRSLWVKLSPSVSDVASLARAAERAGADALVAVNTATAAHVEPIWIGGRLTARITRGGLSGPAIRPIALRAVADIRAAVRIPIVGAGGIASVEDVVAFLAAGASAVQVGTANFTDPSRVGRLPAELSAMLAERGAPSLSAALGAHVEEVPSP